MTAPNARASHRETEGDSRWYVLALAYLFLPLTLLGVCWLCLTGDDR